jgi:hypothetical protein
MKFTKPDQTRVHNQIANMRRVLDGIEVGLSAAGPIGLEAPQALLSEAGRLAMSLAVLDVLERESDQ